jgi:hypothetical protein
MEAIMPKILDYARPEPQKPCPTAGVASVVLGTITAGAAAYAPLTGHYGSMDRLIPWDLWPLGTILTLALAILCLIEDRGKWWLGGVGIILALVPYLYGKLAILAMK